MSEDGRVADNAFNAIPAQLDSCSRAVALQPDELARGIAMPSPFMKVTTSGGSKPVTRSRQRLPVLGLQPAGSSLMFNTGKEWCCCFCFSDRSGATPGLSADFKNDVSVVDEDSVQQQWSTATCDGRFLVSGGFNHERRSMDVPHLLRPFLRHSRISALCTLAHETAHHYPGIEQ